jgi:hypothetical protein
MTDTEFSAEQRRIIKRGLRAASDDSVPLTLYEIDCVHALLAAYGALRAELERLREPVGDDEVRLAIDWCRNGFPSDLDGPMTADLLTRLSRRQADLERELAEATRTSSAQQVINDAGASMSERRCVYRVQDAEGRGPYRPGFSKKWLDEDPRALGLLPWFEEFGTRILIGTEGMHCGSACRSLEQLERWFSPSEIRKLRRFGYSPVSMIADRILAESDIQLVFARHKPLNDGVQLLDWSSTERAQAQEGSKHHEHNHEPDESF